MHVFCILGALALLAPQPEAQEPAVQPLVVDGDTIVLNLLPEGLDPPLTLRDFIKAANEITGVNFTLHEQAAQHGLLDRTLLLYGEKRIPRDDFYSFFQTMMKINNFVCVQQGSGNLEVVMITPVNATTSSKIKAGTRFVDWEDAGDFSNQPGVWVTTVVPLRYAQAQGMGTSLRTALSGGAGGTGNDAFMPIQSENALLIQNYGPFVAAAVKLVKKLDVKPDETEESGSTPSMQRNRPSATSDESVPPAVATPAAPARDPWPYWPVAGIAGGLAVLLLTWSHGRQRGELRHLRQNSARPGRAHSE